MNKTISVIGLGKLGLPFALTFAKAGYTVVGIEINKRIIQEIDSTRSSLYEPKINTLLKQYRKKIDVSTDIGVAVTLSDISFIIVPTPSLPNGSFSLEYVKQACLTLGKHIKDKKKKHTIVIVSTVSPNSMEQISRLLEKVSGKKVGQEIGLCYSPEFIALGQVIQNITYPDFILIGESDIQTGKLISKLRLSVCQNKPRVLRTNFINAEIAKLGLNTYITTKISFGNMIARLCEQIPNAEASVVSKIIGADSRVGSKYLKGSVAYGGPCFPRDNKALARFLKDNDLDSSIPETIDSFNQKQHHYLFSLIKKIYKKGQSVGILGITYKPDTNVTDESPGKKLTELLQKAQIPYNMYDPSMNETSVEVVLANSDIIVVSTAWKVFNTIKFNAKNKYVIDCWGIFKNKKLINIKYIPFGSYIQE